MADSQVISRFGASIRSLRYRLGISQETLAERADLHRTYIAGIETGVRNVTLKSIDKLARALQVSTSTLFLPAGTADDHPEPTRDSSISQYVDILMVEDNDDDVELTLQAFKEARISNSVQVVQDGQEALDFLFCTGRFSRREPEDRPQLVLLDLYLPKIDGVEVLRRIRANKRTRSIPVVVLTESRNRLEQLECQRLGVNSYINKPLDFLTLAEVTPQLKLNWALLKPAKANERNVRK